MHRDPSNSAQKRRMRALLAVCGAVLILLLVGFSVKGCAPDPVIPPKEETAREVGEEGAIEQQSHEMRSVVPSSSTAQSGDSRRSLTCLAKWEGNGVPVADVRFMLSTLDGSEQLESRADFNGEGSFKGLKDTEYLFTAISTSGVFSRHTGPLETPSVKHDGAVFSLPRGSAETVTLYFRQVWVGAMTFNGEQPYELRVINPRTSPRAGASYEAKRLLEKRWGPYVFVYQPQESVPPKIVKWAAFFVRGGIHEIELPLLPIDQFENPLTIDSAWESGESVAATVRIDTLDSKGMAIDVCEFIAKRDEPISGLRRINITPATDSYLPTGSYRLSLGVSIIPWATHILGHKVNERLLTLGPGQLEVIKLSVRDEYESVRIEVHDEEGRPWTRPVAFVDPGFGSADPTGKLGQFGQMFIPADREQFTLPMGEHKLAQWPLGESVGTFEVRRDSESFSFTVSSK